MKNFCLSSLQYNYNTLNNYLSKDKTAYDNDMIRVERKDIIAKPTSFTQTSRTIVPVLHRVQMKDAENEIRDWQYWLSQPAAKRAEAITFLVSQMLEKGQRMDKKMVKKIKQRQ